MKITKALRQAAVLVGAVAAISCGIESAPTAPSLQADLVGDALGTVQRTAGTLLTCRPLPYASDTEVIGPAGGVLNIGPHTLRIPAGALNRNVRITGVAPSDTVSSVSFTPEGLRFSHPAQLTLDYSNCALVPGLIPKKVAYTTDELLILELLPSLDNPFRRQVTGRLEHFSRYAAAY